MSDLFRKANSSIKKNMNLRSNRYMRFLVAGGLNTLFGFAVYSAAILMGAPIWLALLVGMLAGTGFNFITTGGYVFRDLSLSRFPRFVICYLFTYLVNLGLIGLLSTWLGNPILSQAAITIPMAFLAYLIMARFVFPMRAE